MKKLIVGLVVAIAVFVGVTEVANSKTLYQCFQEKELGWVSVKQRAPLAAENGIFQYRGTAEQNSQLAKALCGDLLGFAVSTGYQKALSASVDSSQDYLPVSSLVLKDGTTVNSGKNFLDIEPGGNKEEIVMCTGINTTTIRFTGCTRGLAFSGTSTASVAANRKTHNAGSVIVLSNVHYVYDQFVDVNDKNQDIQGFKTFTSGTVYITSSSYGFRVLNGMLQWSTDGFANSYNFTSSSISQLSASTTASISVVNSLIALIVSSTRGLVNSALGVYITTTPDFDFTNEGALKKATTTAVNAYIVTTQAISAIPSGESRQILFDAERFDALNEFEVTTGTFTAKTSGYYSVQTTVAVRTTTLIYADYYRLGIRKNGTLISIADYPNTSSTRRTLVSGTTVNLVVGDTLDVIITTVNPSFGFDAFGGTNGQTSLDIYRIF